MCATKIKVKAKKQAKNNLKHQKNETFNKLKRKRLGNKFSKVV
jgi:hypothetical protein